MDAHALRRQGFTISAIARHLGHDRKTIRAYLNGGRVAGQRASSTPGPSPLIMDTRLMGYAAGRSVTGVLVFS